MGYSRTGKGLSDKASRRKKQASKKKSPRSSRGGQADRPGEAESKMRKAGVSEKDIKRASGKSYRKSISKDRKLRTSGGMPDRPGEAEQRMRTAGVSEKDIQKTVTKSRSRGGRPDMPGEARQKMIAAGVMTKQGKFKEIVGHRRDSSGSYKFVAAGYPLTHPKAVGATPLKEPIVSTKAVIEKPPGMQRHLLTPTYDITRTSGTQYRESIFDPIKDSSFTGNRFTKWYSRQKTRIGLGGEKEAGEYAVIGRRFEVSKIMGDASGIAKAQSELEKKYKEYKKAKGVSPIKGVKVEKTLAYKAHGVAEKIRTDKPTYGGWQGELSRTINEAVAANVEFFGSAPTLIRHGLPIIGKSPSLIVPVVATAIGGLGESVVRDPVQTIATMGLTGGIIKGATPKIKAYQPKPVKVYHKPSRVHVPVKIKKMSPGTRMFESEAASASLMAPLETVSTLKTGIKGIQRSKFGEIDAAMGIRYKTALQQATPVFGMVAVKGISAQQVRQQQIVIPSAASMQADVMQRQDVQQRQKPIFGYSPVFAHVPQISDTMQAAKEIQAQKYATTQIYAYPTPSISKTGLKKISKEIIPEIPVLKKKDKTRSKKYKKTGVKKQDIKNPIATVEQFMFEVI